MSVQQTSEVTMTEQQTSKPLTENSNDEVIQEKQVHVNKDRLFLCKLCPASFSTKHFLDRHTQARHYKLKPFSGKLKPLAVRQRDGINKTVGATPGSALELYSCTICGSPFSTKSNVRKHVDTIHKQLKLYTCTLCDTSFTLKGYLTKHVETFHSKLKYFSCTLCDKTFVSKDTLNQHLALCNKSSTSVYKIVYNHTATKYRRSRTKGKHTGRKVKKSNQRLAKRRSASKATMLKQSPSSTNTASDGAMLEQCALEPDTFSYVKIEHSYNQSYDSMRIDSSPNETLSSHNVSNPDSFGTIQPCDKSAQIQCSVCDQRYDNITEYTHHLNMHLEMIDQTTDNVDVGASFSQSTVATTCTFPMITVMSEDIFHAPGPQGPDRATEIKTEPLEIDREDINLGSIEIDKEMMIKTKVGYISEDGHCKATRSDAISHSLQTKGGGKAQCRRFSRKKASGKGDPGMSASGIRKRRAVFIKRRGGKHGLSGNIGGEADTYLTNRPGMWNGESV